MWDPYIASVHKYTGAEIVFDKFHVAKKANEALDSVRKKEFRNSTPEDRRDMKNKRLLIHRREKNLPDDKRESLAALLAKNETLTKAYLLKEQLLHILDECDWQLAEQRLVTWKKNVLDSGLKEIEKLLKTLYNYMYGILNYFKYRLTNAGSEGFNNKINLIRRSYGYHDIEYFKPKILLEFAKAKICGQ